MRTLLTALTCLFLFTTPVVADDLGLALNYLKTDRYSKALPLLAC
jgi:hypothetical protein